MSAQIPSQKLDRLYALFSASQFEQLERAARDCTRRHPAAAAGWQMLGVSFLARQHIEAARPHLEQAARLAPDDATIRDNLGLIYTRLGDTAGADAQFARATRLDPLMVSAWVNRAQCAAQAGDPGKAEAFARQALAINPRLADAHLNLGNALLDLGRWDEAEESYRTAMLCAPPGWIEASLNLGNLYDVRGRFAEAIAVLEPLAAAPAPDWRVLSALGRACSMSGISPAARDHFARAVALNPAAHSAHSGYLYQLMHDAGASAQGIFAAHCRFGETLEGAAPGRPPKHLNTRDPERPLRIGFVSGDLREHAVAYFMEPMLAALGQRGLNLTAYSNRAHEDTVSVRLRQLVHGWHKVAGWSDARLAGQIQADRIDILVDLSGHTADNRLPVFALRPAPVQVTWLGYSGTTGMRSMDYRFVYTLTAPPGRLDEQFTEKLVHLPYAMSFKTDPGAPEIGPLPALARGRFTFGSLNRLNKISPECIALWSRVLQALPDARLLVGAVSGAEAAGRLLEQFAAQGIGPERLELRPRLPTRDYLALHNEIDVLLDTFPYAGGTTSNHALWMGVPTLTLAGRTLAQRLGAGIMGKVGLSDWVAESEDEFVARAQGTAANLPALASLRESLRERLMHSPNLSTTRVADSVALAFRIMWQRWCAGEAPQPIILPRFEP